MSRPERLPVSVAIPTIGRPLLIRGLMESIAACDPWPFEVLVVDQSGREETEDVLRQFAEVGTRIMRTDERGVSVARNAALREAARDIVLFTDDDCTVARDWVERAWSHMREQPGWIATGRVLAAGDGGATPWVIDEPQPREYTGRVTSGVLYSGNMVLDRRAALELGGFDERLPAAEDNDFCYRWLRAGRPLRYCPDMVVWHHDWRSPRELADMQLAYGRAQGAFYAKHLRRGDLRVLGFVARDLSRATGGVVASAVRGRPLLTPWRRGILRGMPAGLARGWRTYRR